MEGCSLDIKFFFSKKNITLIYFSLLAFFSFNNIGNAQCTSGTVSLVDWRHQAVFGHSGQLIYDPFVSGQNPSVYDETGNFTTTTCSGNQTTMSLDFERTSGDTNGIAGIDYRILQRLNGTSKFTLTFTNPVVITDLKIGDVDTKSSYVDELEFSANNGGSNVPVILSAGSGVNINGQIVTGATEDGGTLTVSTNLPVTEISFTYINGNLESGEQFVLIKEAFSFCCPVSCSAGSSAPTLSSNSIQNTCPVESVNLNSLVTSTIPNGTVLEWHTSSTPSLATRFDNPTNTTVSGSYYAVFYDTFNNCYSPVSSPVTVSIQNCNTSTICLSSTNCDGDSVDNIDDLDDDNDGILDFEEAFSCGINNATAEVQLTEYDFSTAVVGSYSNVTAGNPNALTVGTYTINSPIGEVYSVGKIVNDTGPLGSNTNLMDAEIYKTTPTAPETTTIDVYNFAHRSNLKFNNNQINRKFVIEYDFLMSATLKDEYGTYISNAENGTVYVNGSGNYNAYTTYRMQIWSHINSSRNIQGTPYRFSNTDGIPSWYRLVSQYEISADLTQLTVTNILYRYNNGTLSSAPVNTTNYNIAVNTTGNQNWLVDGFQAGVVSDTRYDNVKMYWLVCDTDNDGIPNHLDTDSDDDGCPDALEGAGNFTQGDLVNFGVEGALGVDNSLGDTVNNNGIPIPPGTSGNGTTGQATTAAVIDNTINSACSTDLSLTKTVNNALPKVGENITYTLTVTNNSPIVATGIKVTDVLPAGLSYVSHSASSGTYTDTNADSNRDTWDVATLAVNSSVTLQITATITASGTIVNKAEITQSSPTDSDSITNNGQ